MSERPDASGAAPAPAATCPTLREALEKALAFFESNATGETYGAPHVDDPRQFRPDRECNTPEEIAAWEAACLRAEAGETVEIPRHYWITGTPEEVQTEANDAIGKGAVAATVSNRQEGQLVAHIAHEPWGIGVSPYADPEMVEIRDALKAALALPTPAAPLTALERFPTFLGIKEAIEILDAISRVDYHMETRPWLHPDSPELIAWVSARDWRNWQQRIALLFGRIDPATEAARVTTQEAPR